MANRLQVLDFYWTDLIDVMTRFLSKLQYKYKLYTSFKPGKSILIPDVRAFDEANTGIVFQGSYLFDRGGAPLLALFYANASFSRASMSHHPIYSKSLSILYIIYKFCYLCILSCSVFAQLA